MNQYQGAEVFPPSLALCSGFNQEMVAGLTIGKKKYVEVEEEMKEAVEPMHKICEQLLDDIKRDSESFDLYMQLLTSKKQRKKKQLVQQQCRMD